VSSAANEIGVEIRPYDPEEHNETALALETQVVQGDALALSFRRSTFHRRAENFDDSRIFVALHEGNLVGTAAGARKKVTFLGEPACAKFVFDLRVHPAYRNRDIGRRLAGEVLAWRESEDDLAYTWIVDDNRASAAVTRFLRGVPAAQYRYLVHPTHQKAPRGAGADTAELSELHRLHVQHCGPFDLYADPTRGNMGGHVGSWVMERGLALAGCSAWDNRAILAEVVERLPTSLTLAGSLFRSWPIRLARLPHVPRRGESVRSWYLFDCFATDGTLARELFRRVAAAARSQGIDYCYVVHHRLDTWLPIVQSGLPKPFAPILPYNLWARWTRPEPFPELRRAYVDVRDI
jgi:GNAT superfamily N-acetyltransferase